ncbi:MAG: FAD-dependent monooxygenase [Burkholderiaceae bacterium]|nr:FAD-dependent monooxygenase [Burkholderiaceae bacterium]
MNSSTQLLTSSAPNLVDIAVLGAGPAGMAMAALAVADDPNRKILLIDNSTLAEKTKENRVLALSYGSKQILAQAGLWDESIVRCAIERVHVSQQGRLGRTEVRACDLGSPALGYTVEYGALVASMAARLPKQIQLIRPATAHLLENSRINGLTTQSLNIEQGNAIYPYATSLLVRAEGGLFTEQDSTLFDSSHDYQQHALIARIAIKGQKPSMAWERFTAEGPVALVPLEPGHFSLIWCGSPVQTARRQKASPEELAAELALVYGERFSACTVKLESEARIYPLGLNWREDIAQGRIVTIGNAAQTLHPVAGQGLNLALRDCIELVYALRVPAAQWPAQLSKWATHRKTDRRLTRGVTHAMAQFFATRFSPAQHLLGLGLLGLDAVPPLRHWVGNQLMLGTRTLS